MQGSVFSDDRFTCSKDAGMSSIRFLYAVAIATALLIGPLARNSHAAEPEAEPTPTSPLPTAPTEPIHPPESRAADAAPDKPLRWAGTTFSTGLATSLATFGAHDYTGENHRFTGISLGISGGYFLVAQPRHQLRISTGVSVGFALSDSNTTTSSSEPSLSDLPLNLTYVGQIVTSGQGRNIGGLAAMTDPTLRFGTGAHRTWIAANTALKFPTSSQSRALDKYLDVSAAIGIRQQIKLRPDDASAFTHLLISLSGSWVHTFADENTSGVLIDGQNSLRYSLSLLLPVYGNLQFGTGFSVNETFFPALDTSTCINIGPSCIKPNTIQRPPSRTTSFYFDFSYLFIPEFGMSLGYDNSSPNKGLNGRTTNPFYSPAAIVHASAILSFDRLYARFAH